MTLAEVKEEVSDEQIKKKRLCSTKCQLRFTLGFLSAAAADIDDVAGVCCARFIFARFSVEIGLKKQN